MRRLAALSLLLLAPLAGADYWVSIGSFSRGGAGWEVGRDCDAEGRGGVLGSGV